MSRVVFVPGLPGSDLHERNADGSLGKKLFVPKPFVEMVTLPASLKRRLLGPDQLAADDGVVAGEPVKSLRFLAFDLAKQADHLYAILEDCGIAGPRLAKVGWDWRRPVTDPAARATLRGAITTGTGSCTVVAHSTGGLLVRKLLEDEPALLPHVERVVAFGVPWAGTLKPFKVLVGQQDFGITPREKAQELLASSWAAFDLLPRGRAGLTFGAAVGEVDVTAPAHRSWMPAPLAARMNPRLDHTRSAAGLGMPGPTWGFATPLLNIVGWGEPTDVRAELRADGTVTFNGSLTDDDADHQGDGTVPLVSADFLHGAAVETLFLPIGGYQESQGSNRSHSSLWRNPGGRDALHHVLTGAPLDRFVYATVDWSDKVNPGAATVRLRFVMQRRGGTSFLDGVLRFANLPGAPEVRVGATGRGTATANRSAFPRIQGGKFRRIEVELDHPDFVEPVATSMLVEP